MGIQGLLKGLSQHLISENEIPTKINNNICQFANKSLAIDTSSWLYKACYSCAERVVEAMESRRIDPMCERIVCNYIIKRCDELLNSASVKEIILVFDGKRCPLKVFTNREREKKRTQNLKEARQLKASGRIREAQEKYKSCIKVADWMAHRVNRAVAQKWGNDKNSISPPKVRCVFSPYEADAQLAILCKDGLADAVVTEDSDVLVYSAACGVPFPIIYKLDRNSGNCDVISMDWLLSKPVASGYDCNHAPQKVRKMKKKGPGLALSSLLQTVVVRESRQPGSGARLFVQSCVLAGCDYAPSCLSGVGLVTAFKLVMDNSHREPSSRFSHILKVIPRDKISFDIDDFNQINPDKENNLEPRDMYEEVLSKSEAVFYHHHVLDLKSMDVVPLMMPRSSTSNVTEKVILSDEEVQSLTGRSDRAQYLPCLKRFSNVSFIGSNQCDVLPTHGETLTSAHHSGNTKLSSLFSKPQILCHKSREKSHLFFTPKNPGTKNRKIPEERSCSWINRKRGNPLSKFGFHSKEIDEMKRISIVNEIKDDDDLILSKAENQKDPLNLKSGVFKKGYQSCTIFQPADRLYGQNERVNPTSLVSVMDSSPNEQEMRKKQKLSKYFTKDKNEKPIFKTKDVDEVYSVERVKFVNIITPPSDKRENMEKSSSKITPSRNAKASDRGTRKLIDLLSKEEDSVKHPMPASPVSSLHELIPSSSDNLVEKNMTIGVDSTSAINVDNIYCTNNENNLISLNYTNESKKTALKTRARIFPLKLKHSTTTKNRIRSNIYSSKRKPSTQSGLPQHRTLKSYFSPR